MSFISGLQFGVTLAIAYHMVSTYMVESLSCCALAREGIARHLDRRFDCPNVSYSALDFMPKCFDHLTPNVFCRTVAIPHMNIVILRSVEVTSPRFSTHSSRDRMNGIERTLPIVITACWNQKKRNIFISPVFPLPGSLSDAMRSIASMLPLDLYCWRATLRLPHTRTVGSGITENI